ncbi:MAG TPA: AAA family ATPase [Candidatus Limnocylindrales bacterium]|nr:AAA family ATPase [Candidatus Limnocylindrales bacterium]
MRQLFLAATGQNRGKTTAALGLLDGFRRRGYRTGFSKPVGQRTLFIDGEPCDEDADLMRRVFDLPDPFAAMSPVHIPRGFTKRYLAGDTTEDMESPIMAAQRHFAGHDIWLIEGTGHAGVGAVVGLSNARVASMLRAPTVIISEGGVGRPIDEIVLNASHFEAHGVPVVGAIVNKIRVDESPGIEKTLERGLALHGIPLLGVLPYRPILSNPTLGMILRGVKGELICPGPDLDAVIDGVAIGAMEPHHMLLRVGPRTLVIVPGDREDAILTLAAAHIADRPSTPHVVSHLESLVEETPGAIDAGPEGKALGIVLTGGYTPRPEVLDAVRNANIFCALVPDDTYTVASEVHDLLVKTHPEDTGKIQLIKDLVWEHLQMDRFLEVAAEARFD